MSITVTIENDMVKLPEGVHLPDGTPVRLEFLPDATAAGNGHDWPAGYFERTAGALVGEQLERPAQGQMILRTEW